MPASAPTGGMQATRPAIVVGELAEEDWMALTAALFLEAKPPVLLLDSPKTSKSLGPFLETAGVDAVRAVGFASRTDLESRLQRKDISLEHWKRPLLPDAWKPFGENFERLVVCPAKPRELLLQAATLAGVLRAPLVVLPGDDTDRPILRAWLADGKLREIYAVGAARAACRDLGGCKLISLADAPAVASRCLRCLAESGPIETLVVANPHDVRRGMGRMSLLAPWLAVQRRAALLLTNDEGDNVPALVREALKNKRLQRAENLILLADLRAIRMERRPNPAPGKDDFIEMEPLTPTGSTPFTFATGRLFHEDLGVLTLALARQQALRESTTPRKALVASNAGGGLALLEAFSRHTAKELRNCGYDITTRFAEDVDKDDLRRQLPNFDIFLWEGHHNTLIKEYGFAQWDEPLKPSFIFLQSCLALMEEKALPLFQRGAVAVVGCSTRTYSGSGGAFSLAYFDAMLYDQQTLGGALRQAKNYLLAYALLKEKRLGEEAKLGGANLRSAWAFTLWGDPTLKLPAPAPPANARAAVEKEVHGATIKLLLPDRTYDKVWSSKYLAEMPPNARLAGIFTRGDDDNERQLIPLLFAEVSLPNAPAGKTPRLKSKLSSNNYVFCWDERRRCGYLLVRPRSGDTRDLQFKVQWAEEWTVHGPH